MTEHPVGIIHGRFQVLHLDHLRYLLAGKRCCDHLVVGITNPDPTHTLPDEADPARSLPESNPLTYYERYRLVTTCLLEAGVPYPQFSVVPFPINQPHLYSYYVPTDAVFFLTIYDDWGRRKHDLLRAAGLRCHVLWERDPADKGISAGEVRALMATGRPWQHLVPEAAARLLSEWEIPARLAKLRARS